MSSRRTAWIVRSSLGFVVVVGVIWYLRARGHAATDRSGAKPPGEGRVVPVQVATVDKHDFPVWLDGLGTVAAFQQVTVRAQVDGRLDAVKFVEGQAVKKGDVIAQIDPRPFMVQLHTAEGALARDQAQLAAAKADLSRQISLHEQNLVSQSAVDVSKGNEGNLEGAVKIDQAQIENARLQLDYAQVKAPLDGLTGVRQVDAGNVVHATDPNGIVVITAVDPAAVLFALPQDRLPEISAALAAGDVTVEVWNRDGSQKLATGTLAVIDNQVNAATSTMRLKAIVPNPKRVLWPNAFVKARMLVATQKDALVVPAAAVQQGPNGSFVFVVQPDASVKMTPVVVALTAGDTTVIGKGLAGGEQVVTEGASQLRDGGKVDTGAGAGRGSGAGSAEPHRRKGS